MPSRIPVTTRLPAILALAGRLPSMSPVVMARWTVPRRERHRAAFASLKIPRMKGMSMMRMRMISQHVDRAAEPQLLAPSAKATSRRRA